MRLSLRPSCSENDPTTLFTSSGMQPLIPYLLGQPHPLGKRLVNSQEYSLGLTHDLAALWDGQIQTSLDAFRQPPLRLFAPGGDEQLRHPFGEAFENLTTPLNTEELSLLANLPLREMPGIPMQPSASFSLNPPSVSNPAAALKIGRLLDGGEEIGDLDYDVDLDTLTRHVFITGITGSGKSNTCRRLLASLMEAGRNFLVIEPAKDEYVQLALAYNQSGTFNRKIAVYVPGRTKWGDQPLDELRLNPFDIIRLKRCHRAGHAAHGSPEVDLQCQLSDVRDPAGHPGGGAG